MKVLRAHANLGEEVLGAVFDLLASSTSQQRTARPMMRRTQWRRLSALSGFWKTI